jgi:PIN domain nuclease of toxin-antitoxin system
MKILLDTHIFIWWVLGDSRLSQNILKRLEDDVNTIYLSSASVWEIIIKHQIGRMVMTGEPSDWINRYLKQFDLRSLPITHEHALAVYNLPVLHKDPFDRILIAQALHENMTLASNDSLISMYDVSLLK